MTAFLEALSRFDEDVLVVAAGCAAGTLILACWFFAAAWHKIRQSQHRAQLTAMMVQRGMPVDEIERVLRASSVSAAEAVDVPADDPGIIKMLTDNNYEGSDVQRILSALHASGGATPENARIIKALSDNWADTGDIERILLARRDRPDGHHQPAGAAT